MLCHVGMRSFFVASPTFLLLRQPRFLLLRQCFSAASPAFYYVNLDFCDDLSLCYSVTTVCLALLKILLLLFVSCFWEYYCFVEFFELLGPANSVSVYSFWSSISIWVSWFLGWNFLNSASAFVLEFFKLLWSVNSVSLYSFWSFVCLWVSWIPG